MTRSEGVPFHTDAVQSAGQVPVGISGLGVQALSISGHKLGAPKGTGALFLSSRLAIEPVLSGGAQERGRRSGTENVAGAVALGAAVTLLGADAAPRTPAARDSFVTGVLALVPGARLTGAPTERLPGHASFVFPGTSGESVLLELERRGVVSSSGSACSAGSDEPSHVLTALGVDAEVAQTAVRFSWGADVTESQLEGVVGLLADSVAAVSGISA